MKNVSVCLAAGVAMVMLAGCSSTPTAADFMRQDVTEQNSQVKLKSELAKSWDKGSSLVESGENLVESGEKIIKNAESDLEKGRDRVEKGNEKITEGKALMQESEQRFQENFPGVDISDGN